MTKITTLDEAKQGIQEWAGQKMHAGEMTRDVGAQVMQLLLHGEVVVGNTELLKEIEILRDQLDRARDRMHETCQS